MARSCLPKGQVLVKKEEFVRDDPGAYRRFWILRLLTRLVPVLVTAAGIFVSTQRFAPMMNFDESVIGTPLVTFKNGYSLYNPLIFLLGIFKYAFNETYSFYFFKAAPPAVFSLTAAFLLFFLGTVFLTAHQKNQHIHGTARWATAKDLREVGHLQKSGVVCGELSCADVFSQINPERGNLVLHLRKHFGRAATGRLVCHSGSTNTWMIAPTRSGKGVSVIIPTLLSYGVPYYAEDGEIRGRKSVVVFDPKGENYAVTSGYRSQFSVTVPFRPLDPDGRTAHYNPIQEIPGDPDTAFAWADMIGEIFFGGDSAKSASDGTTEYFNNKARDIFSGVVLHVRFSPDIPLKEKNLGKVLSVFSDAGSEPENDDGESGGPGGKMLAEMEETDHGSEKINALIRAAAARSKIQPPKERASTYSTVFSKISLFQDPLVAGATAYSDFSVDDFIEGKNGISLYLIVPYNHIKRIAPVFRMLITFMIKKFSDGATNAREVKLKNPCLFLLDEFPVLGYFPDIALNAGILAGYGVTFFIVSQSINQIVETYGENHPFLDHCKTKIIFAPGNYKDANMASETIGKRSVLLDNISSSMVNLSSANLSSQETCVSLINPDELMKLEFSRCIILLEGKPPYKGKKVVYYEDPRFKDHAFMKEPEFRDVMNGLEKLPSRMKARTSSARASILESIRLVESVDVLKLIPADYDIFRERDASVGAAS